MDDLRHGPAGDYASQSRWHSELLTIYAPSFPTGGFAYSQGLETAVYEGDVSTRDELEDWLNCLVTCGSLRNDLIFLAIAARENADGQPPITETAAVALALQPSAERARETHVLGLSFKDAVEIGWPQTGAVFSRLERRLLSYPIACGLAASVLGHPTRPTLTAYANLVIAGACAAAIRLSIIGQFDGVRIQAALAPLIEAAAVDAVGATTADLASATFAADIASMRHETQTTRLFQS